MTGGAETGLSMRAVSLRQKTATPRRIRCAAKHVAQGVGGKPACRYRTDGPPVRWPGGLPVRAHDRAGDRHCCVQIHSCYGPGKHELPDPRSRRGRRVHGNPGRQPDGSESVGQFAKCAGASDSQGALARVHEHARAARFSREGRPLLSQTTMRLSLKSRIRRRNTLHQAQSGPVDQRSHQPIGALQFVKHLLNFGR